MLTRVRRRHVLAVALAALLLPIATGSVAAAKAPKIAVCHLDQVLGTYSLVMIAESSLAKHLAHGDGYPGDATNCQLVVASRIFVTAFTDLNGDHAYYAAVDSLTAELLDTDHSNTASIGDTVVTDRFPLDFTATNFADATITSFAVTAVAVTSTTIEVQAGNATFHWEGNTFEQRWFEGGPDGGSDLTDTRGGSCSQADILTVGTGGPSAPSAGVDHISAPDCADNAFLDISRP